MVEKWMPISISILSMLIALFGLVVSYGNLSAAKTTQRINIFASLIKAHDNFGVATGRPSLERNRDRLNPSEIHDNLTYRAVWDAYNDLNHQIDIFEIAMPRKFLGASQKLREEMKFVYASFSEGNFEKISPNFEQRLVPALLNLKNLVRNEISLS